MKAKGITSVLFAALLLVLVFSAPRSWGYTNPIEGGSTETVTNVWSLPFNLDVGHSTSGNSLIITAGGHVSSGDNSFVGRNVGADNNTVTVTGSGSVWESFGGLNVGYRGSVNNVTVTNSGEVYSANNTLLGRYTSSGNNTVMVSGSGSLWESHQGFYVGYEGSANSVTVADGGHVFSTNNSALGRYSSSGNNTALITGSGSVWETLEGFSVGYEGSGNSLTIADGGHVYNDWGCVGNLGGSDNNTALITGSGSIWSNSGVFGLVVGDEGSGNTLSISDGGEVVAQQGVAIRGVNNALNLNLGGRLRVGADFDASMIGFNYNAGSTLVVEGQLSGLSSLETDRRLEAVDVLGDMTVHGTFAPGTSPADSILDGALTIATDGTLEMELGGHILGDEYDRLTVTATAYLDGTLNIVLLDGFTLSYGDTFDLFNWEGGVSGEFDTITTSALTGALEWDTSELYTSGTLAVIPEPSVLAMFGIGFGALWFISRSSQQRRNRNS